MMAGASWGIAEQCVRPEAALRLPKGAALYAEGDSGEAWFEVRSGLVRTCRFLPDGHRQVTGFFFPGDVLGVDAGPRRATAEAATASVVIRHNRRELAFIVSDASSSVLGRALERAEDRILLLGLRTAAERLAGFLRAMGERGDVGGEIVLPMSRSDIADHLALTVETISRTFSQFVRGGLIVCHGPQRIHVLDRRRLQDVADGGSVRREPATAPPAQRSGGAFELARKLKTRW
jgi:CRP/FNR family transcriptional regulator, nitrogen fixation regulation protein